MITLRGFVDLAVEISEPASRFDTALLETAVLTNSYAKKKSTFPDLGLKTAVATHREQESCEKSASGLLAPGFLLRRTSTKVAYRASVDF